MKCISPITLKDPQKIRGSLTYTVPCGKCGSCRHNRRTQWTFRLNQELKNSLSAYFLTLTYENCQIPFDHESGLPTLDKTHIQKFLKRLRRKSERFSGWKIRYYCVGEYGTHTQRPHYHIILFNLHTNLKELLLSTWQHGLIHIGKVTEASIHYTTKYHVNYDKDMVFGY